MTHLAVESLPLPLPPPPPPTHTPHPQPTHTAADCCRYCDGYAGCRAWTFDAVTDAPIAWCWLKGWGGGCACFRR